ncbi:hypothetical protein [Roseibium aquae]|uniref:hypothetical protein n=1 Tax=Roseibium aquae TaxID=1323746 RepID=UPI00123D1E1D|nr:hypothetical protein [Roseibium aquae]
MTVNSYFCSHCQFPQASGILKNPGNPPYFAAAAGGEARVSGSGSRQQAAFAREYLRAFSGIVQFPAQRHILTIRGMSWLGN